MLVVVRIALFLVALIAPGGLFVLAALGLKRFFARPDPLRPDRLDFEGSFRRVPDTRRGRHRPILVSGAH